MRYNCLRLLDLLISFGGEIGFNDGDYYYIYFVMKKVVFMWEYRFYGGIIMVIVRVCSEKYGVR